MDYWWLWWNTAKTVLLFLLLSCTCTLWSFLYIIGSFLIPIVCELDEIWSSFGSSHWFEFRHRLLFVVESWAWRRVGCIWEWLGRRHGMFLLWCRRCQDNSFYMYTVIQKIKKTGRLFLLSSSLSLLLCPFYYVLWLF